MPRPRSSAPAPEEPGANEEVHQRDHLEEQFHHDPGASVATIEIGALAAGVSVFELARIMGTSGEMIERAYGTLIEGAGAAIATRLDAFDARSRDVWATSEPCTQGGDA